MPPNRVRYYFARLNLIPAMSHDDKREFLQNALSAGVAVVSYGVKWQIFRPELVGSEIGEVFVGFLGRYKDAQLEVARGEEISIAVIEDVVSAKTPFFLHLQSGVVAYHTVHRLLESQMFLTRFPHLIYKGAGGFFVDAEARAIEETLHLANEMRSFDRVLELDIFLHPSNPSNRDVWRRQDDRLKRLGAMKYREKYETPRSQPFFTLRIMEDEEIQSKIAMAEDGYGEVRVSGEKDGRPLRISTRDNPVSVEAPVRETALERVLESLERTFRRIFERFIQ